ncbi:hypothetical protein [Streptomyces sp. NPDC050287]|uniref:hypothetical protein n=1 Tax=Streptomyces sp. NPDC050287 TaxID=3365608 RepID=UPI0037A9A3D2
MIKPDQIPQFTGNLTLLETDNADLKKDAGDVRKTGEDVHSQFQGLSAYYTAPEAEQLFATTKPVKERADDFATDLETVSGALSSYATEVRPLVDKLEQLKADATTFVASVKDDDDWEYDEDKVDKHNQIRDDITATVAAFWAAERTCHNKITSIWGGTQMVAGDGSDRKDQYGFNADDLKNAKLPWGDPVEEKHHWYEVGHWVKSFVWDGLIVDGIWGTIKGLGTLVGFGGWDAMGQAWKGLAQLATGLAISSIPGMSTLFWTLPDDKLPSWIRDSRTAMKETGKALVAWDEWGKNPGRAAGAVTFNVLTTVFTGGAGGAAAGAGKAGAVAKVLSVAGKAGKVIDPMTYIAKGAGAGLSKIGDITKALKGVGNIEIPKLPETAITLPEGTVKLPDGTVHFPEGTAIPEGATKLPDGNYQLPHDTPALPEGSTRLPTEDGAPARYYDPEGNLLDERGNVLQQVDDGPGDVVDQPDTGTPASGSDVPHTPSPTREPAMAGVATHTADNAAQHINLGNSLDTNLGDVGRVGEDIPTTAGAHAGGDLPTVHAGGDLPGSGVADHLPGGSADHLPGGHVGDHMPTNDLNAPHRTGHGDTPSTNGTHPDTPSTTDHPNGTGQSDGAGTGGTHPDDPGTGGGHHEPPSTGGSHPDGLDDTAQASDDVPTNEPPHSDDLQSGAGSKEWVQRTPEQMKWWHDEHVRLANENPDWFKEHYDIRGHRRTADEIVDGQFLPKLTEGTNPRWVATDSLPSADREYYRLPPKALGLDSVQHHVGPKLDELADAHKKYLDLGDAQRAYDKAPTTEHLDALQAARDAMGDLANNTKVGEALGEGAAKLHVIPEEFASAEWVDLMETGNGARRFDQLYRLDNGRGDFLIVEAKAPGGELDWRLGAGDHARKRVKQGTLEYVHTILEEMKARGGTDKGLAEEMARALRRKKVQYVMIQANKHTGSYAGAELNYFDLYREGR